MKKYHLSMPVSKVIELVKAGKVNGLRYWPVSGVWPRRLCDGIAGGGNTLTLRRNNMAVADDHTNEQNILRLLAAAGITHLALR